MLTAVKAGLTYFSAVFAVGFVLGTIRVLVLIPRLGEAAALLIELPVMLAISWVACRRIVNRFSVSATSRDRLSMGGTAFALLMLAEFLVSSFAFGRSASEHIETYRSVPVQLGLAAQVAFALMPFLLLRGSGRFHR